MSKAATYYHQVRDDRQAWAAGHTRCWICNWNQHDPWPHGTWMGTHPVLHTHEMLPKSKLPNAWGFRENYFRTCARCHQDVIPALPAIIRLEVQLAIKHLKDACHYSLDAMRDVLQEGTRRPILADEAAIEGYTALMIESGVADVVTRLIDADDG